MPKVNKSDKIAFYAVAIGHNPGIYPTWDECKAQVKGVPGAKYKKFSNASEAESWVAAFGTPGAVTVKAPRPGPSTTQRSSPYTSTSAPLASTSTPSTSRAIAAASKPKSGRLNLEDEKIVDESNWNVVYSDGSCRGNGKADPIAGIGVWWGQNDPRNLSERCPGGQTNNRAELIAIIRILETTPMDGERMLIKTDSQYSMRCVREWLPTWKRNGWRSAKGEPVKNVTLIKYLDALLHQRGALGQRVHLQYVRGHAGEEGNEGADRLANLGAMLPAVPDRNWDVLTAEVHRAIEAASDRQTYGGPSTDNRRGIAAPPAKAIAAPPSHQAIAALPSQPPSRADAGRRTFKPGTSVVSPNSPSTGRNPACPVVQTKPVSGGVPDNSKTSGTMGSMRESENETPAMLSANRTGASTATAVIAGSADVSISEEDLEAYASCLLEDEEDVQFQVDMEDW
ncbi:Ribonuclease H [Grifola frondosa]|uniref:ribonuclease H n=1 Tax=Grifola frondosa TaxID=5627 RepID=A0A1C7LLX8_GRIFR|nr:Ribonuclease H [Grifola frondosa]